MRWDALFEDLAGQWDAESRRELDAEVADRTRRERASVGLYERLSAAGPDLLTVSLRSGDVVRGRVADVGDGWLLLVANPDGPPSGASSGAALVPFAAVTAMTGLSSRVGGTTTGRRFGLGYALRGLSRDRAAVLLTDLTGAVVAGTIDAVGRDVLELSQHDADLPRRPENVTGRRLVPFAAVVLLRPA